VKKVDVRLLFATNKNLKELVSAGKFREDLYYRLNVFPIRLPSLRERPEDIPDLARHFLAGHCAAVGRTVPSLDVGALEAMMRYPWPGNVRELEHVVERLVILVDGETIGPLHVSSALFSEDLAKRSVLPKNSEELKIIKKQIRESSVLEVEKLFVEEALARNDWNVSRAARQVNMQRSNFQALMKKYGIRRPSTTA
jgi:two-component system NtrC family response regulator